MGFHQLRRIQQENPVGAAAVSQSPSQSISEARALMDETEPSRPRRPQPRPPARGELGPRNQAAPLPFPRLPSAPALHRRFNNRIFAEAGMLIKRQGMDPRLR